jgi:hypothetical protein
MRMKVTVSNRATAHIKNYSFMGSKKGEYILYSFRVQ